MTTALASWRALSLALYSDDVSVFEKTFEFINKNKIDSSFFGISTPLPNTVLHKKLDEREDY